MSSSTSCSHGDAQCYFCSAARTKRCCSCRLCNQGSYATCQTCNISGQACCHLCGGRDMDVHTDPDLRSNDSLTLVSDGGVKCYFCSIAQTKKCYSCLQCNRGSYAICETCIGIASCHVCGRGDLDICTNSDLCITESPIPIAEGTSCLKSLYELTKVIEPLQCDIARKVGEQSQWRLRKQFRDLEPWMAGLPCETIHNVYSEAFKCELEAMHRHLAIFYDDLAETLEDSDDDLAEVQDPDLLCETLEDSDDDLAEVQYLPYKTVFVSHGQSLCSHVIDMAMRPLLGELLKGLLTAPEISARDSMSPLEALVLAAIGHLGEP